MRIAVTLVIEMTDEQVQQYADEFGLPAKGSRLYAREVVEDVQRYVLTCVQGWDRIREKGAVRPYLRCSGLMESGSPGVEESRLACRRSAATSARSASISAACSTTTAVSSAFRAASSSYDGCTGCGIPEPNRDHKADASTDTPQINGGVTGYGAESQ